MAPKRAERAHARETEENGGEGKRMQEKGFDLFETWMEAQSEFSESWLKAQSELLENWISTTKSMQNAFVTLTSGEREGATKNDLSSLMDSWRTTLYDASKVFTDGLVQIQEGWKATFDKQMEMSREIAKKNAGIIRQAEKK